MTKTTSSFRNAGHLACVLLVGVVLAIPVYVLMARLCYFARPTLVLNSAAVYRDLHDPYFMIFRTLFVLAGLLNESLIIRWPLFRDERKTPYALLSVAGLLSMVVCILFNCPMGILVTFPLILFLISIVYVVRMAMRQAEDLRSQLTLYFTALVTTFVLTFAGAFFFGVGDGETQWASAMLGTAVLLILIPGGFVDLLLLLRSKMIAKA